MWHLRLCKVFPYAKYLLPNSTPPEIEKAKIVLADAERTRADRARLLLGIDQELASGQHGGAE